MKDLKEMDAERLICLQEVLKKKLVLENKFTALKKVGGADVSYSGDLACCTICVLDMDSLKLLEERTLKTKVIFPYLPTFLSFREAEPIVDTYALLNEKPDVMLIDGHGIAHPRGLGLASHVGVLLDSPTIGVAKSPLVGDFSPPQDVGASSKILFKGKTIGFALKSKSGSKLIFISPGHMISLNSSLKIVKRCLTFHRLPEPLLIAHRISKNSL